MQFCHFSDEYERSDFLYDLEEASYSYLEGCKSVCGKFGSLWPKPTGTVDLSPTLSTFNFDDVSFKIDAKKIAAGDDGRKNVLEDWMTQSWTIFTKNVQSLLPSGRNPLVCH